jgi:hypothetical protein
MNLGTGNGRQTLTAVTLGVLALGACFYIYEELFATGGSSPTPAATVALAPAPARPASGTDGQHAARPVVTTGTLDPTLHMQAMLVSEAVAYSGSGRNIFSAQSAPPPVPIPQPVASARPTPPPIPCPPNCPPPPPPPPIDLKFFGVEIASNGARQACLLHDDAVYLASPGDVVLRRYKVLSIDPKSIQVQDMQNNNTQVLPLLAN